MWSAVDSFSNQGMNFIVSIIIARVVAPREFGLIGMTLFFIAISQSFIESGFSSALIRKNNATQSDYSTVFYFNLAMGLLFYALLFFSAGLIGEFFKEPMLKPIIRILGLNLIIRSLTIIQSATLVKRVDFKLQAKITVIAAILSGIVGITLAYSGYGVWSLVLRALTMSFFISLLLWSWNRWRPSWLFSLASFRELFGFGSKILLSGLIDTVYRNIYLVVIGKFFSATDLGYFTRAQAFKDLPSQQITNVVSRVTYPVLSEIRDNPVQLKGAFKRSLTSTTFLSFIVLAGVAAVAEPMIITFIGEPWRPAIIYLQMLCFTGMLLPLQSLNLNMLHVQGRSDLFLRFEIIKKLLAVPVIIFGILYGIEILIAGMMAVSVINYYIDSYYSGQLANYPMREQVKDVLPAFLLSIFMAAVVFISGLLMPFSYPLKLFLQIIIGAVIVYGVSEILHLSSYQYFKENIAAKFSSLRSMNR